MHASDYFSELSKSPIETQTRPEKKKKKENNAKQRAKGAV
jgi:hypothetical protein